MSSLQSKHNFETQQNYGQNWTSYCTVFLKYINLFKRILSFNPEKTKQCSNLSPIILRSSRNRDEARLFRQFPTSVVGLTFDFTLIAASFKIVRVPELIADSLRIGCIPDYRPYRKLRIRIQCPFQCDRFMWSVDFYRIIHSSRYYVSYWMMTVNSWTISSSIRLDNEVEKAQPNWTPARHPGQVG